MDGAMAVGGRKPVERGARNWECRASERVSHAQASRHCKPERMRVSLRRPGPLPMRPLRPADQPAEPVWRRPWRQPWQGPRPCLRRRCPNPLLEAREDSSSEIRAHGLRASRLTIGRRDDAWNESGRRDLATTLSLPLSRHARSRPDVEGDGLHGSQRGRSGSRRGRRSTRRARSSTTSGCRRRGGSRSRRRACAAHDSQSSAWAG